MSDVMIQSVYIGITGACISSYNNRGFVLIPEGQEKITKADCDNVRDNALLVFVPPQSMFLHTILQHYYVDGRESGLNPVGMIGQQIEADFHIVHGRLAPIENAVRCVKELSLEVEDVVLNPLATAKAVLDADQRKLGALVIDIGGGTTDYLVYVDGAVCESGSVAMGAIPLAVNSRRV